MPARARKGRWSRLRTQLRMRWSRLTDDQLAVIEGRRQLLLAKLQDSFGATPDEAERQVSAWEDEVVQADVRRS